MQFLQGERILPSPPRFEEVHKVVQVLGVRGLLVRSKPRAQLCFKFGRHSSTKFLERVDRGAQRHIDVVAADDGSGYGRRRGRSTRYAVMEVYLGSVHVGCFGLCTSPRVPSRRDVRFVGVQEGQRVCKTKASPFDIAAANEVADGRGRSHLPFFGMFWHQDGVKSIEQMVQLVKIGSRPSRVDEIIVVSASWEVGWDGDEWCCKSRGIFWRARDAAVVRGRMQLSNDQIQ